MHEKRADALARVIVRELDALPERKTAPMRAVRREHSRALKKETAEFVFAVAYAIIDCGRYRWIADELVAHHREAFSALNAKSLEHLGRGMSGWDQVDSFARSLTGPAWLNGHIEIARVRKWARSKDRWWRRTALVSTVALNTPSQGGHGDTERTLAICATLVSDRDDMVVKVLSWALRSLVPHDARAVKTFLRDHDPVLAARVKREVRNKIATGYKNP